MINNKKAFLSAPLCFFLAGCPAPPTPSFTLDAYFKDPISDAASGFGLGLAADSNTLAVGSFLGDVNVFFRNLDGSWVQQASIVESPASGFGRSISIDGDTMAIGAGGENKVHVYTRTGDSWTLEETIDGSSLGFNIFFGGSVAVSGDTLAVSGIFEDSVADNSGAVYIYTRSDGSWMQEDTVKASNPGENDTFGFSLSLDGDTLAVGARWEDGASSGVNGDQFNDVSPTINSGAAYVFTRDGTEWLQQAYIKASNTDLRDDEFGTSVSLKGNSLIVVAPRETGISRGINGDQTKGGDTNGGAVYLFSRTESTWSQDAYFKPSNNGGFFGDSVSLSTTENEFIVGATTESSGSSGVDGDQENFDRLESGAAYVFAFENGQWTQTAYIKASNNTQTKTNFGLQVAHSDVFLAVSSNDRHGGSGINPDPTDETSVNRGAVYTYNNN